ncbi:MAG: NAD(P)-dependent alcohol dehydrogenase [Gammaproteobacteria bacterium]|nr:NAD(P)-dependent alcohol dehydrogenase [Gammaproteobacteria bacterium]
MKGIFYSCYGSPDVLEYTDLEKPVPEDDEVLIKVHAASVNPYDWHFMRGSPYLMRLLSGIGAPKDTGLGADFAGTVEAIGKDVSRFKPGDEVFGAASGAFSEYVIKSESGSTVLKPAGVSFEQGASVAIAAVTALQALRDKGKIKSGQKVLINGASGGVGTFAVQIAKSFGAEVTGVCSTRNVEMVKSIGADHVFDYKKEDYTESGEQFDLIVDLVGNHGLLKNRQALSPNGIMVLVGGKTGNWIGPLIGLIKAPLLSLFVDQQFLNLLAELSQEDLTLLGELIETGKVKPVIDKRFELSEVADAIRYSETGRARGKIIINL